MADTVDAVLDFLKKNNFLKAEAALRAEVLARSQNGLLTPELNVNTRPLFDFNVEREAAANNIANISLLKETLFAEESNRLVTSPLVISAPVSPAVEPGTGSAGITTPKDVPAPLPILDPAEPGLPRLPSIKLRSVEKKLDLLANGEGHPATDPAERLPPQLIVPIGEGFGIGLGTDMPMDQDTPSAKSPDAAGLAMPSGRRSKRPSVSLGIVEDTADLLLGLAVSSDHQHAELSDHAIPDQEGFPNEFWDSDTYDDEDDPGYVRQPIEDEDVFLARELDYPNEEDGRRAGTKNSKLAAVDGPLFEDEEETYFSGEEYYLQAEQALKEKRELDGAELESGMGGAEEKDGGELVFDDVSGSLGDVVPDCEDGSWGLEKSASGGLAGESNARLKPKGSGVDSNAVVLGQSHAVGDQSHIHGSDSYEVEDYNGNEENGPDDSSIGFAEEEEEGEGNQELIRKYYEEAWGHESKKRTGGEDGAGEMEMKGAGDDDGDGEEGRGVPEDNGGDVGSSGFGGFSFPTEAVEEVTLGRLDSGGRSVWSVGDNGSDRGTDERVSPGPDETLKSWRRNSSESSPLISPRDGVPVMEEESFEMGLLATDAAMKEAHASTPEPREEVVEEEADDEMAEEAAVQEQIQRMKAEEEEYETFELKIVHRKNRTGFEEEKDFPVVMNTVIAGRYHVTEYLGSAAFSKAIQAHDLHTGMDVCMKIIKNNKDFFDQSLDEIKLLKYINKHDPADRHHILRLYDYFYHKEHLFIVCELLRANLYEFHKYNRESGGEVYFTMPRLQSITRQCLEALKYIHSLGLIHCDLKPENILVKSYSRCEVKVIDLGSSCFQTDHLCSYVQSRSYRAPEVILGLPYGQKIDIWSLGCILAELCSGNVLFQNDSLATLLARVVGIIGPIDPAMLRRGRDSHKYFTKTHMLYERNPDTDQLEYLIPKKSLLRHRLPMGDPGFIEFVGYLLQVDPEKRPSASEALNHPWLSYPYDPVVT